MVVAVYIGSSGSSLNPIIQNQIKKGFKKNENHNKKSCKVAYVEARPGGF